MSQSTLAPSSEDGFQVVRPSIVQLNVGWADSRTYSKQPDFKSYIESPVIKYCGSKGIRANEAVISGPAHEGGTNADEPRHVTVKIKKRNGSFVMAKHPLTKQWTKSHHIYI